jgi:hypothetical protein
MSAIRDDLVAAKVWHLLRKILHDVRIRQHHDVVIACNECGWHFDMCATPGRHLMPCKVRRAIEVEWRGKACALEFSGIVIEISVGHPSGPGLGLGESILETITILEFSELDLFGRRICRERMKEPSEPTAYVFLNVSFRAADLAEI